MLGNRVYLDGYREFESLPLRQKYFQRIPLGSIKAKWILDFRAFDFLLIPSESP